MTTDPTLTEEPVAEPPPYVPPPAPTYQPPPVEWVQRSMFVPAAAAPQAQGMCAALAGTGGTGLWLAPWSATGAEPATHYLSTGPVDKAFADLLPLVTVTVAEDGTVSTTRTTGQAAVLAALAAAAGLTTTEADIQALLDVCDITDLYAIGVEARAAQLGLQPVKPPAMEATP